MGEGEHCKKYSRDLMNISKKGQNPFFSIYSLYGCYRTRDMFVDRVVPETTEHPTQPMVSFS